MSKLNYSTICYEKTVTKKMHITEILCYECYYLQNFKKEIDFLTSYVFLHHRLVKDERSIRFCSIFFWAVCHSLKNNENSILDV